MGKIQSEKLVESKMKIFTKLLFLGFSVAEKAVSSVRCDGVVYKNLRESYGYDTDTELYMAYPGRGRHPFCDNGLRLYLSNNANDNTPIDWRRPTTSLFDKDKPVVLTVHGWFGQYKPDKTPVENSLLQWQNKARQHLKEKVNYVAVNWDVGAGQAFYTQSVLNSEVVGRSIAYFLNQLKLDLGVLPSAFHCIGHSLGAHVCGFVGKYAKREFGWKIGRITGLDPAFPEFYEGWNSTEWEGFGKDCRLHLSMSDARFVDVIHTDSNVGALCTNQKQANKYALRPTPSGLLQ